MRQSPFPRVVVLLLAFVLLGTLPACGKKAVEGQLYHCPMHPAYISDHPGDCPICGMRLVPVETQTSPPQPRHYVCPMHPEVTAEKPGKCPQCGMDLVPAGDEVRQGKPEPGVTPHYVCPMHLEVTAEKPGKCPQCGMDLVPAGGAETGGDGHPPGGPPLGGASRDDLGAGATPPGLAPVQVGEAARALAGIQTAEAREEEVQARVRTVGIVMPDETLVRHFHTKISGWVDKLFVNFTGQLVRKGEPVLALYSPALLSSQEEFLKAREVAARFAGSTIPEVRRGGNDLLESARKRLELFDVPAGFIAKLEKTGKPLRAVTLLAPASGFVTAKAIFEGHQVEPGMELYTVTDLSRVWIEADFYEYESRAVRVGAQAVISFPYDPGRTLQGKVSYVYPYLDPDTRTLKVRFDVPNPELVLRPSMYVDVLLEVSGARSIVIPDSAVMDSGIRQIVFVDRGGGSFDPREVKVGMRSGGRAQVLSGLAAGEKVVMRANFLLDSESRLRAAIGSMSDGRETHTAGGAP